MQTRTNQQYVDAVDAGIFPTDTPRVPIEDSFVDARGSIRNLLLCERGFSSVAEIKSKRGTVRANHYHKTDWHYTYVASGMVLYFERAVGDKKLPEYQIFGAGEMFFTPPMREHAMVFAKDTTILTFAKNVRNHEQHEADLVRVVVVDQATVNQIVP